MSEGPRIAPSILSADFLNLGKQIQDAEAAGADWIHLDVMDGHFVPNLSMGPAIVEACRRATQLPLDVHLMVDDPSRMLQDFVQAGANHLTVHIEATPGVPRVLQTIHDMGLQAGISLNPGTPAAAIREVLSLVDIVLVMTVNPGYSGQRFLETVLPKVRRIRAWLDETGSRAVVEVDGGIDRTTAPRAAESGAEVFVAAKAVFGHPQGVAAGIRDLRKALALAPA